MTTPIAYQKDRAAGRTGRKLLTFDGSLRAHLLAEMTARTTIRFPSTRYREDPAAFAREILGVEPWFRQVEILCAVRDHSRVAVRSGHKIGKSSSAGMLALWFYCSYPDARVVMSSTTARQVDQILWREVRMLQARGGRCVACKAEDPEGFRIPRPCPHSAVIPEEPGVLARTGLRSADFREIVGFTAREAEAVAGISGGNLIYILDEASGIPQVIFEAIEGNRAGGAKICMYSNPTKNEGEFYDAFYDPKKSKSFYRVTVSSEETPNAQAGKVLIPGLATREWIEEKREEWGEDSALFKIRVLGVHALQEEGRIFSVHAIATAEERWKGEEGDTPLDTGRLFVGCDPAGPTGTGDETVFALRRGLKVISLHPMSGLDADAHLIQILDLIRKNKRDDDQTPVVVIDKGGEVGSKLWGRLLNFCEMNPGKFEAVGIQASDKACRKPEVFDRMRDLLTANLEDFIRNGGAIPEDPKLSAEMHQMEWFNQVNGRQKVTPKDHIRKNLGRSPDRYDAVALACWTPASFRDDVEQPLTDQKPAAIPASHAAFDHWEETLSAQREPGGGFGGFTY